MSSTDLFPVLPAALIRTVQETFGERGRLWLAALPEQLADCAARWSLTLQPPFSNLTFHYVAPAMREDGTEVVLKMGVPHKELRTESAALAAYAGHGSVRLLEADSAAGVLLLERLRPGKVLTLLANEAHDPQATSIAASVMRRIWRPPPPDHAFPTVYEWARGLEKLRLRFDGGVGPFPPALVEEAETRFTELLNSMAAPVLLHGDLHHDNILSAARQPWLAIDPKGVVGEPAYEVGALLRNLWEDRHSILEPQKLLERRVHQLAEELELERERVKGWGVAQAVLSAWWCLEDDSACWESSLGLADMLSGIRI